MRRKQNSRYKLLLCIVILDFFEVVAGGRFELPTP